MRDIEEAVYLTEVDENGAERAVHSINAVARVKCPHVLHPLERQPAAMVNKTHHIVKQQSLNAIKELII